MIFNLYRIENFVVKNGFYPSESDLNAIFRRLDIDKDGRVSFDEFKKILSYQDYSKITGMKDEELNPHLQSYSNMSKYLLENVNSNNRLSSNDFEYKNSVTSLRGQSGNMKKEMSPMKEKLNSISSSYDKTSTLEREFNKASPRKSDKSNILHARNENSSFLGSNTSFIKKNYILLEEEAFQEMLRDIIEMNKEIELLKCDLAICNDFNLLDSFRYFQSSSRDFLYATDIKNGLNTLEIPFSDEEVDFFINRYDCNKSRVIS